MPSTSSSISSPCSSLCSRAEPSALAPYAYTRLVFAAVLGTWLFGDVIAGSTVAGALLIVGSNLALFWYVAWTTRAVPR